MKCIYCKNDATQTSFLKREHLIPRSIGGINTLENGMVCDTCNEYFSKYEKRFNYDTYISMERLASTVKGRHGSFKSHLGVSKDEENGDISITYIEQGYKQIQPPQFVVSEGDIVKFQGGSDFEPYKEFQELIKIIKTKNKKVIYKTDDLIPSNSIFVLCYKKSFFYFIIRLCH